VRAANTRLNQARPIAIAAAGQRKKRVARVCAKGRSRIRSASAFAARSTAPREHFTHDRAQFFVGHS
jgi:hypothetical protein